jgi:hypothetical protein
MIKERIVEALNENRVDRVGSVVDPQYANISSERLASELWSVQEVLRIPMENLVALSI